MKYKLMSQDHQQYEDDSFEQEPATNEKKHALKLSIDFLAVKDMKVSASISVAYGLRLVQVAQHQFKSQPPTPVNSNQSAETKLQGAFASYEFQASKGEILALFSDNRINARV